MNNNTPHSNPQPRFSLKGCPKCKGDLQRASDQHGHYQSCVQCGYHIDIDIFEPSPHAEPEFFTGNFELFPDEAANA